MSIADETIGWFETRGHAAYHGEAVSQTEHALQAACCAERVGASDALVVAALLHDLGHLVDDPAEDLAERQIDGRHEDAGAAWLASRFGPEVTEPVRLHVAAKRYLCAVDPQYAAGLSPASVRSLAVQGGPFTPAEAAAFAALPGAMEAVRLRRWDDAAKVPGLEVPGLEHYRARIEALAAREAKPR